MKNLIALIDAICDVYDRLDFRPNPDGSTHCNQAVQEVAEAMGYFGFKGLNANQMVALMESSDDWSVTPIDKSQDLANQGSLVIAGLDAKALSETKPTEHGHVVVIRPGKCVFSPKWDKSSPGVTPRVVNIGGADFIGRGQLGVMTNQPVGLNEAFQPMPKIFVWRPSL